MKKKLTLAEKLKKDRAFLLETSTELAGNLMAMACEMEITTSFVGLGIPAALRLLHEISCRVRLLKPLFRKDSPVQRKDLQIQIRRFYRVLHARREVFYGIESQWLEESFRALRNYGKRTQKALVAKLQDQKKKRIKNR